MQRQWKRTSKEGRAGRQGGGRRGRARELAHGRRPRLPSHPPTHPLPSLSHLRARPHPLSPAPPPFCFLPLLRPPPPSSPPSSRSPSLPSAAITLPEQTHSAETRSSRSEAARALRRPDERVKYDAGDCDDLAKASQRCLQATGYDRAKAAKECEPHYEAYRNCRRAVTAAKRKDVKTIFG